jgi:hypothetical protein
MTSTHRAGKSALDQFLSESVFTPHTRDEIDQYVAPADVELDSIDTIAQSATPASSSSVQMWPMLAAALVAIGVAMLALAVFARIGISPL